MEAFLLIMMFFIPVVLLMVLGMALVYGLFHESAALHRRA